MALVALPTGGDVLAYLGQDDDDTTLADTRVANVTTMAKAYTRGVGFVANTVAEDIAAVIVSATARELNVSPGLVREEIGNYSVLYDTGAYGFTIRELLVLNAFRRRAI